VTARLAEALNGGDLDDAALRPLLKADAENISRALIEEAGRLDQRAASMREIARKAQYEATQRELVRAMKTPEAEIDLFHAALLISKLDNPELDVRAYREQLTALVTELKESIPENVTNDERLNRVIRFLFAENGFTGADRITTTARTVTSTA
jgi:fructose-1,6-bisphosphatase